MTPRWRRVAFPVLALVVILILASTLSSVLTPVAVAVLLAVIVNPLVGVVARFGLPRTATVILLYVMFGLVLALTASTITSQFQQLARDLGGEPFYGDKNGDGLINLAIGHASEAEFEDLDGDGAYDAGSLVALEQWVNRQLSQRGVLFSTSSTLDELRVSLLESMGAFARPASDVLSHFVDRLAGWAGGLVQLITLLVLIPFYLFFFLVEYPAMSRRARELVPPRYREQVDRIARDIGTELVAFLRGRLACGLAKALFLFIGMLFIGIDHAMPIALATGLLSLIPVLGFIVGALPASVIALTMAGGGTETLLLTLALFGAGEALEGAVLFPLLLGKETGLHPVALVVVLLSGGVLFGTLGVVVAIPLALVCKVLWRELVRPLYLDWAAPVPGAAERVPAASSDAPEATAPTGPRGDTIEKGP